VKRQLRRFQKTDVGLIFFPRCLFLGPNTTPCAASCISRAPPPPLPARHRLAYPVTPPRKMVTRGTWADQPKRLSKVAMDGKGGERIDSGKVGSTEREGKRK